MGRYRIRGKRLGWRKGAAKRAAFVLLFVLGAVAVGLPLASASSGAHFSGRATVYIVGKTGSGALVRMSVAGVDYSVGLTSTSLSLSIMGMAMGGPLASGSISISAARASGGGMFGGSTPSQFGFVAGTSGGQFECLMAGFTAGFPFEMDGMSLTIIQMDVHGSVSPGSFQPTT